MADVHEQRVCIKFYQSACLNILWVSVVFFDELEAKLDADDMCDALTKMHVTKKHVFTPCQSIHDTS